MLRTSQLSSRLFDQVMGRTQPKLLHPTSNAFDPVAWSTSIEAISEPTIRDLELATAAIYFHREIVRLRQGPIKIALDGLTTDAIIKLSVAESNRGYLITKRRLEKAMSSYFDQDDGPLNTRPVIFTGASPSNRDATPDDVVTAIGDTLPHWFHQAVSAEATITNTRAKLGKAGQAALMSLSLERSLRDLWHDVLWEGHFLNNYRATEGAPVLAPSSLAEQTLWAAWHGRFDSLCALQGQLRLAEIRAGRLPQSGVLERTVVALVRSGRSIRCRFGKPNAASKHSQTMAMDHAESAYLGIFLDEPLGQGTDPVTPRQLMYAWFVLQDLGRLLISDIPRTEIRTARDLSLLAAGLPKKTILLAIRDALGVSESKAIEIMAHLTTDAIDVGKNFQQGLWHRPLVARPGSDELLLVLPILMSGSPTRRIERWLAASGRAEALSSGPRGLAYEAYVRATVGTALTENKLFSDVAWTKNAIARKGDGEEIDAVFRVGRTVLVCEVKCLLVPTESVERYYHIKKLEAAAEQALRKAAWLQAHPQILMTAIGPLPSEPTDLIFIPLVVLNHGVGLGLEIDGCLVTDLHFLELYLSGGSYTASNFLGPNGTIMASRQNLYESQPEAEAKLMATFANPPGLTKYFKAVVWRGVALPTSNGGTLRAPAYVIDESRLISPEERIKAMLLKAKVNPT